MWTEADRESVRAALASGERSVTFADGRKIEYQTTREMMQLLDKINAELAAGDPTRNLRRATVARMGRRR
jgi:hypothetical protein